MSTFSQVHQGLAYGDGTLKGAGLRGQGVSVYGNDQFQVNTDPAVQTVGFLKADAADGALCTVMCNGGVYETDVYTATGLAAGDSLAIGTDGKLKKAGGGEVVVGRVLSVAGGLLKFISLV